ELPGWPGHAAARLLHIPRAPRHSSPTRRPRLPGPGPPARARLPAPLPAPAIAAPPARRPLGSRPPRATDARRAAPGPGSPPGGRGGRRAHGSTGWRYGHGARPGALPRHRENAAGRPHLSGTAPRRTRSEGAQHPLTAAPSPEVG